MTHPLSTDNPDEEMFFAGNLLRSCFDFLTASTSCRKPDASVLKGRLRCLACQEET
jgi:hypothetical protein